MNEAFSFYAQAMRDVEAQLGDPLDAANPFGFRAARIRDEREDWSADDLKAFEAPALNRLLVPASLGGDLAHLCQLAGVNRAICRRDQSLSLRLGFGIWATASWIGGDAPHKARVAGKLLAGHAFAMAISERNTGADLLRTGTAYRSDGTGGWVVEGEKWPIGNLADAGSVYVLARREGETKPRALGLFLVDGPTLRAHGSCREVPKLGLRAMSLASIGFAGLPVAGDDRVGADGTGLETVLKMFQITRPLVAGLGIGAADTCLRLACAFVGGRTLYQKPVDGFPVVRAHLVRAHAHLLAAEALHLDVLATAHHRPETLSYRSLIAKIMIPALTGASLATSKRLYGARFFLREGPAAGIFEKHLRDHEALALFDGSSEICLQNLFSLLAPLLTEPAPARTSIHLRPGLPVDEVFAGLSVVSFLGDPWVAFWNGESEAVLDTPLDGLARTGRLGSLVAQARVRRGRLIEAVAAGAPARSERAAALALEHCWLHTAGVLAVRLLDGSVEEAARPALLVALALILEPETLIEDLLTESAAADLADVVLRAVTQGLLFSAASDAILPEPPALWRIE